MEFIRIRCGECGQAIEIPAGSSSYGCMHCGHFESGSAARPPGAEAAPGQPPAKVEGQLSDGERSAAIEDGIDPTRLDEAENYSLQATFILHSLQANLSVYGSNSAFSGAQPADVDLALRYINRSLEIWPNSPKYLNLKALFLIEGQGNKADGLALMERAAKLAPNDITIQSNLEKSKQDSCFIASAIYRSESAYPVVVLREWRDRSLMQSISGRIAVRIYYSVSPLIARMILTHPSFAPPLKYLCDLAAGRLSANRTASRSTNP